MAIEGGEVTIQSGDNNQAADAAEAAKVEAAQAELAAEEQTAEPDKILGRFESVDDLASAYQELQRAYSKGKADEEESDDELWEAHRHRSRCERHTPRNARLRKEEFLKARSPGK